MLLAIDAGNTNIVFALYEGDRLAHSWRCQTIAGRTADEYAAWLYQLFTQAGLTFAAVKDAVIGSVVPDVNFNLVKLCADTFGCDPLIVSAKNAGIKVNLKNPDEAGADRLLNAAAATRDYGSPVIVIDFGTATTFDVVNAAGEYCGGAIAPGPNLSAEALYQAAAKLPRVGIKKPVCVIGTDTVGAMQSGLYWGYVGLIEGLLKRTMDEMGVKPRVIATGGLAGIFAEDIPLIEKTDGDLTLRGLLYIYESSIKNQKAA
jgi:type III pantothenate kinase